VSATNRWTDWNTDNPDGTFENARTVSCSWESEAMPKRMNDDELVHAVEEATKVSLQLGTIRERKKQHEVGFGQVGRNALGNGSSHPRHHGAPKARY